MLSKETNFSIILTPYFRHNQKTITPPIVHPKRLINPVIFQPQIFDIKGIRGMEEIGATTIAIIMTKI